MSERTAILGLALAIVGGCTPIERCEDRLAQFDREMDALIAADRPERLAETQEGIDRVPVSPTGEAVGHCVLLWIPGLATPERERRLEDLDHARVVWRASGRGEGVRVCALLDARAPIGPVWGDLQALAREGEVVLVVADPWSPPPPPPMPAWVRAWIEAHPDWAAGAPSPSDRLRALGPVIERADRCEDEGPAHIPYVFTTQVRVRYARDWIEGCRCAGIDVSAAAAILWLAYAPRLPPHRALPLRVAGAGEAAALELAPGATAQALVEALARAPGAAVRVQDRP